MHSARHARFEEALEYLKTAIDMSPESMDANRFDL